MIVPTPFKVEIEAKTPYRDESSFREMEPLWAQALKGSITLDPTKAARPITQGTLKTKLMETRISYELNNWKSQLIPVGASLREIKINCLKGGLVQLKNDTADKAFLANLTNRITKQRLDFTYSQDTLADVIKNRSNYVDNDVCFKCANLNEEMSFMSMLADAEIECVRLEDGAYKLITTK